MSTPAPPTMPLPEPVPYITHIGKSGQDALWAGFVLFLLATLVLSVMAARHNINNRTLHIIMLHVTGIATLSYYAMATGNGVSYVPLGLRNIQGHETLVFRPIFWARYVDWALTAPLILFALALLAGMPWIDVLLLVIASEFSVLTTAFAGLQHGRSASMWGWYAFSCIFLVLVFLSLLSKGLKHARQQSNDVPRLYTLLACYTVVVWIVYPVIFALGDGTGILNPDASVIAYTVLDLLAKAGFGMWMVSTHKFNSQRCRVTGMSQCWTEARGGEGVIQLPGEE